MTTLVDAPTRVDGVQLIGEMVGSGYRTPPALVRRADGQVLQLTPLLYLVLHAADGRRSCAEIAEVVGRAMGRSVAEDDVRTWVDNQLRPLGLLKHADGSEPELKRSNPLLGLKPRFAVTNPRTTHRLTDPFRVLFRPVLTAAVLVGFVVVVAWVFLDRGLGASAYDAFERPQLLLLVFVVSVLSGGFHEFGHAAAARYSGAEPGVMGAGLYLVWPAFYTDVTDSYRLGRAGRIRTDLWRPVLQRDRRGPHLRVVVGDWLGGLAAAGRHPGPADDAAAAAAPALRRLPRAGRPGGVPDLYHRIRPTLLGLLPHRWKSPENKVLTPWARATITFWVLVTIPMMALMLLALVAAVPRLLGTAGSAVRKDATAVAQAWSDGAFLDVAAHTLQVLGVVLPVLACALILGRIGTRTFRGLATWSRGSAGKRVVAAVISATLVTALSWAWWPHPGNYQPIQPGETGILTSHASAADGAGRAGRALARRPGSPPFPVPRGVGTAAQDRLSDGQPLVATFQKGDALPTKDAPALALVLVPTGDNGSGGPAAEEDTWVFPFDKPLPPAEGDNQALAVAKDDGSVTYDLAFALVWAEGDEVLNVNEAHAYASCSDCVAVAVAFQVVLIMDDAQVVVPQNLAVSANYDCYRCITAAIASQLVLSVTEEPGEEDLRALGEVWSRLIEFAQEIHTHSLTEIIAELDAAKAEIVAILGSAPTTAQANTSSGSSSATGDEGTDTTPAEDGSSTGAPASSEPAPEQEETPADPPAEGESTPTEPSSTPTEATEPTPAPTPEEDTPAPTADSSP